MLLHIGHVSYAIYDGTSVCIEIVVDITKSTPLNCRFIKFLLMTLCIHLVVIHDEIISGVMF